MEVNVFGILINVNLKNVQMPHTNTNIKIAKSGWLTALANTQEAVP